MIITRVELYAAVWKTPARHLARTYGISDVALTKICRRHVIPKPWKGYWAEKKHGKERNRPSLPPWNGVSTIEIKGVVRPMAAVRPERDKQLGQLSATRYEVPTIENWEHAHPQVKYLREAMQKPKEDQTGRIGVQRKGLTRGVLVSRPLVARALALLEVLFRRLEEVDCTVTVAPQNGAPGGLVFHYEEGSVDAQLIEEVTRVDEETSVNRWTYKLTARLAFKSSGNSSPGSRQCWRDTKSRSLEHMLGDIIAGVLLAGRVQSERAQRWKEHQQRREQERVQQEAAVRLKAEETAWQNKFQQLSDGWSRYERLRNFISACESSFAQSGQVAVRKEADEWLARAKRYAEGINPLAGNLLDGFAHHPSH